MAESVVKLKVDSAEYNNKIKRASDSLIAMAENAKRTGAALSLADKEEVAFVASLGKMQTAAKSAKGKLREMTQSIADLTSHYRELSAIDKNSEYGKALKKSIEELTQRAGNLRDVMDDTAAAIGNVATDTQFANGMNMMTNAVGQCASAVVAWTGGGKEMEQVIKDLAKIQTTIAAVKALTEAFQKQNMVLMKNPYVLAATAVAALATVIGKLTSSTHEETYAERQHREALEEKTKKMKEYANSVASTIKNSLADYEMLRRGYLELSKADISNWIKNNSDEFKKLGLSIKSAADAENAFVNNTQKVYEAFIARASAAAIQNKVEEIMSKRIEAELNKENISQQFKAGDQISGTAIKRYGLINGVDYYQKKGQVGNFYTEAGAAKAGSTANSNITSQWDKELNELYELKNKYEKIAGSILTPTISGTSVSGSGSGITTSEPEKIQVDVTQSLTDLQILEDQLATVKNSMKGYGESTEEWKAMNAEVESLTRQIDILNGKAQEVQGISFSFGFSSSGTGDYIKMMQSELANADFGTTIYQNIQANLQDASALTAIIQELANKGVNDADLASACETLWDKILGTDGDAINSADWSALEEQINAKLAELNIEPIKLDIKTGNVEKTTKQAMTLSDKWSTAANMIQTAGNALNNFESPAAKIGGIIAQTVATLAAAYAQNLASDQTTKGNIWAFIAAAAAATVSLGVTVAAVKKNAEYHAQGGVAGLGNSTFIPRGTDTIPAMLTPGETILSVSQTRNLAENISNLRESNSLSVSDIVLRGEDIFISLQNTMSRTGNRL